jgi:hypothetical protein
MDYQLISLKPTKAHIQFSGMLNNKNVIWDATIQTLSSLAAPNAKDGIKQYIDIPKQHSKLTSISVALNVEKISTPEILKTIIMITNYKNLKTGRHEYGEEYYF